MISIGPFVKCGKIDRNIAKMLKKDDNKTGMTGMKLVEVLSLRL